MRQEYQEALKNIPKRNLIYLDESGFDLSMRKEYGWKVRGQRLYDNKKGQRKYLKRITVISAYSNNTKKLVAPFYFEGNTNSEMFNLWIKEVLLPELKPNQTIVMDIIFTNPNMFYIHKENVVNYDNWFMFQRLLL